MRRVAQLLGCWLSLNPDDKGAGRRAGAPGDCNARVAGYEPCVRECPPATSAMRIRMACSLEKPAPSSAFFLAASCSASCRSETSENVVGDFDLPLRSGEPRARRV